MLVSIDGRRPDPDRAWLQAYTRLRERIVSCELAPGARLSESTVAKELGLSRTPVREALIRLHVEGLVRVCPQRGSFVAPIDPAAAEDAQLLRVALESQAARRAARVCDEDSLAELRSLIERQRRAGAAGDLRAFLALDDALHLAVFALAGLSRLWPIVHSAKAQLDRVRFLTLQDARQLGAVLAEHETLAAAVGSGQEHRAEAALKRHLRSSYRQITDRLADLAPPAGTRTSNDKEAAPAPSIRRILACPAPASPSPAAGS